jgi:hypothetical protein
VGHDLVASLAARGDDDGCTGHDLDDDLRPCSRGVRLESRIVDDVRHRHSMGPEKRRGVAPTAADEDGLDGLPKREAELAGDGQGLQRKPIGPAVRVLDEGEDHGARTPRRRRSSTTRGAASGPEPSTSAVACSSIGTRRRTF